MLITKFSGINNYSIQNLINQTIWFSTVFEFNDFNELRYLAPGNEEVIKDRLDETVKSSLDSKDLRNLIIKNINITNYADTRKTIDFTSIGAEAIGTAMNRVSGGATWSNTVSQVTSVQIVASSGTFAAGSQAYCEGRNVR